MKNYIALAVMAITLASCATSSLTRDVRYPKMYEEKPLSIVVMPPINRTNHVDAKDFFYTTLYTPLCEKGYYVFSPMLTMDMFQSESAYDAEPFLEGSLAQFRNVLGADAAMFTIIKSWNRSTIGGSLTVEVEYILRSTVTGETLYQREGKVKLNTSVSMSSKGLLGALLDVAATAAKTASTDKIEAGRKCTAYVLSDMPEGKYGLKFGQDQKAPAGKERVEASIDY